MSNSDQSETRRSFVTATRAQGEPRPSAAAPWLWGAMGVLLAAVIGVAAYRVWPILHPTIAELAIADPGCDLHSGACVARFSNGSRVRFAISPNGIPVASPLDVSVELEGLDGREVQVDFVGVDMDMGFNRMSLAAAGAGRFVGKGMLPVCVRERMLWEARVLIDTPKGLLAAPFRFETTR